MKKNDWKLNLIALHLKALSVSYDKRKELYTFYLPSQETLKLTDLQVNTYFTRFTRKENSCRD